MVRFGLVLGALVLVGCGAGGGGSSDSDERQGGAGTASQASSDAGGQQQEPAASTECEFRGPYALVAVLTSGAASCSTGAEYERVTIQTRDENACTAVVCVDGLNCVDLDCERGNPVSECTTTIVRNGADACTYEWTLSRVE